MIPVSFLRRRREGGSLTSKVTGVKNVVEVKGTDDSSDSRSALEISPPSHTTLCSERKTHKPPKPSKIEMPNFFILLMVMFHTMMHGSRASTISVIISKALTVCRMANDL